MLYLYWPAATQTLMDVLADRKTGGTITGEVLCNGFPKDRAAFARMMGYCEQARAGVKCLRRPGPAGRRGLWARRAHA